MNKLIYVLLTIVIGISLIGVVGNSVDSYDKNDQSVDLVSENSEVTILDDVIGINSVFVPEFVGTPEVILTYNIDTVYNQVVNIPITPETFGFTFESESRVYTGIIDYDNVYTTGDGFNVYEKYLENNKVEYILNVNEIAFTNSEDKSYFKVNFSDSLNNSSYYSGVNFGYDYEGGTEIWIAIIVSNISYNTDYYLQFASTSSANQSYAYSIGDYTGGRILSNYIEPVSAPRDAKFLSIDEYTVNGNIITIDEDLVYDDDIVTVDYYNTIEYGSGLDGLVNAVMIIFVVGIIGGTIAYIKFK